MPHNITMVCVTLFNEGTDTIRGTDAIDLGDGLYKLLATPGYDPEDETWEFLPGSIVRAKPIKSDKGLDLLLAYEMVSPPR